MENLIARLKEDWYSYGVSCGHDRENPRIIGYVLDLLDGLRLRLICKLVGHDLEEEDYGTPESGYMGVNCVRCGWSAGSRLY